MPYFRPGNIHHLEFLCPFFAFGILTRNVPYGKMRAWTALLAAAVYLAAFHFFSFDVTVYKMRAVATTAEHLRGTLIRLFGGISGILLALYLVQWLMRVDAKRLGWLVRLGTLTLPIYAMHQKFYEFNRLFHVHTSNILAFLLATAAVIVLTLCAYKMLSRSSCLAFFLFGVTPPRKER